MTDSPAHCTHRIQPHSTEMINNTLSHLSQTCLNNLNNNNNNHLIILTEEDNITEQLTRILNTLNQFKQQLETNTPVLKLLKQSSLHLNSLIHAQSYIQQQQQLTPKLKPRSTYLDPALILNSTTDTNTLTLIEALAHEIKLESFRDSEDSLNLLTIAGKLFVIDIEILNNKVHRSKFSYTFAEEEAKRDLAIDHELTHQLQNIHLPFHQPDASCHLPNLQLVQQSLRSFATSLRQLKEIDELMTLSTRIDYFMVFRTLINDYHQQHSSSQSNTPNKLAPSGIPLTSPNQLKLDLIYHYNSTQLINQAIQNKSTQGLAISVALTTTTTTTPSSQDKALFTAHFSPPLPASRFTAAALAQLSAPNLQQSASDPHPSWACVETPPPPGEVFLEDLLVDQAMNSSPLSKHPDWDIQNCKWKSKQFGKEFDDGARFVFSCLDALVDQQGRPVHPNSRLGFMISQVRFDTLDTLLKIIQICQRQSIFNEMFNSCFNPDCYLPTHRQLGSLPDPVSVDRPQDLTGQELGLQPEVDPFVGFQASDYLAPPPPPASSSAAVEEAATRQRKEVAVDLILDHAAYSMTLQFATRSAREKSGGGLGEGVQSEEEWEEGTRMSSLTFGVSEHGAILLQHASASSSHLSPSSFPLLQLALDRSRCLPVLLHAFFNPS